MTTPKLECPKCGRMVPGGVECAGCGVVFAKLAHRAPRSRRAPSPTGAYQVVPRRSLRVPLLGLLAVGALGALAAAGWIADDDSAVAEPGGLEAAEFSGGSEAEELLPPGEPAEPAQSASKRLQARKISSSTHALQEAQVRLAALPELEQPAAVAEDREPQAFAEPKPRWVAPDSTWFEGAGGFERGLDRARQKNQAVLVYFYADWCGYCRQLERDLLNRAVVQEYTKYLVKVRVNPESGAAERALATTYGVSGYPSVFVHPAGLGKPKKIRSMTQEKGSWRSLATRDYVENLVAATGERFGAS